MNDLADESTRELIREAVADRYSAIGVSPGSEQTIPAGRAWAERLGYPPAELDAVPSSALESFTGIGAPLFDARLAPGERVLDLGCGAGLDSVLMARRVGPEGHVYAVDLAAGMVAAARQAVAEEDLRHVTVLQAPAERLPLPNGCVDVAVVNGLFNLTPDKSAVMSELARVIRPGGRLVGAEIVITDEREPQPFDAEAWFR